MAEPTPMPSEEAISAALKTLSQFQESPNSISSALSTLATSSRQDPAIRTRLADPKVLGSLVSILEALPPASVSDFDHALRCLANASANNDSARDTISENLKFAWAIRCLNCESEELRLLTTKVLYNICSEHEGAQKECYREGVHLEVLRAFGGSTTTTAGTKTKLNADDANFIIDLLFWITGHKAELEPEISSPLNLEILNAILSLHQITPSEDVTPDTYATISETILVFLRDTIVQGQIAEHKLIPTVRQLLRDQENLTRDLALTGEDVEDVKLLTPLNSSLVWCLSDIAAHPEFVKQYSIHDEVILEMIAGIKTAALQDGSDAARIDVNGSSFISDCQVLGNLFWALAPADYVELAEKGDMHEHLFAIIAVPEAQFQNLDALHSMAGLLIQLSRPSVRARQRIGEAELAPVAIDRLVKHHKTEIRHDSLKLLKALGKECPPVQRRFADLAREAMLSLQQQQNGDNDGVDSVMELPT